MAKYRRLTAVDFQQTAMALQAHLAYLSVPLDQASDLAEMIGDLEWVGSLRGEDILATAIQQNPDRAARCLPRLEQARRMATALEWAKTQPGLRAKRRLLKKSLDRLKSPKGPALDFLFEVDVAFRAVQAHLRVELAEPDIVLTGLTREPVGLACKRPESIEGLTAAYRKGRHQIARQNLSGIVVFGMENIVFDAADEGKPWKSALYTVDSARDIRKIAAPYYCRAHQVLRRPIAETPEQNVAGVILCACVTAMITKRPSAYGYAWPWTAIDREEGRASRVADRLFGKSNRVSWALLAEYNGAETSSRRL